jgi:hypothetical protein
MIVHRLSNTMKDLAATHLELMREAIAKSREILKGPAPDSFTGRKTQEPFPSEDDIVG